MVRDHFAKLDANQRRLLTDRGTKATGAMRTGAATAAPHERTMRDPNAAFDRLDANRDGSISRDEFAKGREVRIERRVDQARRRARRPERAPMRMPCTAAMMGGRDVQAWPTPTMTAA